MFEVNDTAEMSSGRRGGPSVVGGFRRGGSDAASMRIGSLSIGAVLCVASLAVMVRLVEHDGDRADSSGTASRVDTSWQSPPADLAFVPRFDGYYTADADTYIAGADSRERTHRIYLRFFADGTFCAAADELGFERTRSSIMASLTPDTGESSPAGETHCDNRWQASALAYEADVEPRRVELLAANDEGFLVTERNDTEQSTVKTGYLFHAAPTG